MSSNSPSTGSKKSRQVYCDVCKVYLSSASLLQAHNNGKKHQALAKLKTGRTDVAKRSVYVRGYDYSDSTDDELRQFFLPYGNIKSIYFDKEKGLFAILEFETEESAKGVLSQKEPFVFKGKSLKVKPKTQPKEKPSASKEQQSSSHGSSSIRKQKRSSGDLVLAEFVSEELLCELRSALTVEEQMESLIRHLDLTEDDTHLRTLICQLLAGVFQEFYPSSKVLPFGSSANGLGWKGCDMDICLLMNTETEEAVEDRIVHEDQAQVEDHLEDQAQIDSGSSKRPQGNKDYHLVTKALKTLVPGIAHVVPVFSAKCPVIKFVHQPSGTSCDLTINNRLGIENTRLLGCYLDLDPRVKQLVFTVRAWARTVGVSRAVGGQLTNYALTLMAVYYLQMTSPPVIPSLQCLAGWPLKPQSDEDQAEKCIIEGWDCSFLGDVDRLSSGSNGQQIEQLLAGFFDFYGNKFDFGNCAVNVRTGQHCTKLSLQEELQDKYHKDAVHTTLTGDKKAANVELKLTACCVQDPFELSHNVTQNIGATALRAVIQHLMDASRICRAFAGLESSLPESDSSKGIIRLLQDASRDSHKKRKLEQCSFDVPLSQVKDSQPLSTQEKVFKDVLRFLKDDLRMQCDVELRAASDCNTPKPCMKSAKRNEDADNPTGSLMSQESNDEIRKSQCGSSDAEDALASSVAVSGETVSQKRGAKESSSFVATCTAWEMTWS